MLGLERISLAKPVSGLSPITLAAAGFTLLAAILLGREALATIPAFIETNYGYDAQLRATAAGAEGLNVTWVDLDDETSTDWSDENGKIPRSKFGDIINRLATLSPSLILLDADLTGEALTKDDAKLAAVLKSYDADTPLLLTRALHPVDCSDGSCEPNGCKTIRDPSRFDEAVSANPKVRWVSRDVRPDGDGIVRKTRLWETVCTDGAATAFPSPQLAAIALASPAPAGDDKLKALLEAKANEADGEAPKALTWPNATEQEAHLPFVIGGAAQSSVPEWTAQSGERYQRVSALSVFTDRVDETAFKDRVIVIGTSSGTRKVLTPVGAMPSAALIANAIAVAPEVINNHGTPAVILLGLALLLATAFTAIAKTLRTIPAAILIALASYLWLAIAAHVLPPAEALRTVSMALLMLGLFLAVESMINIGIALIQGKGPAAFLRKPVSPSTTSDPA